MILTNAYPFQPICPNTPQRRKRQMRLFMNLREGKREKEGERKKEQGRGEGRGGRKEGSGERGKVGREKK